MVIAIVILGIACAEATAGLIVLHLRYAKLQREYVNNMSNVVLSNINAVETENDLKELELDLSFPNTEGGF